MQTQLKNKNKLLLKYGEWAIVTGASSGIGFELAQLLAQSGFNIVLVSRDEGRLNKAYEQLKNEPVLFRKVHADLSQQEGIDLLIRESEKLNIGLLVNNAGFGSSGSFIKGSLLNEVSLLRVNCEAVLHLSHYFAQRFKQQKRGAIVFLSSLVAFQGVPYSANYAASKAYVQSLAEALSHELKPFGIDVLSVAPGPVNTSFGERANMQMNTAMQPKQVARAILESLGKQKLLIPGNLSKLLFYSLATAPRFLKVIIMGQVMKGFTQHQTN